MRVVLVAPNIPVPGTHGGSTHVTEVMRALRRRHEVLVLARRGSAGDGVIGIGGGVWPGLLRYLLAVKHFPAALAAARAFRPDIIYERFSGFGLGAMLAKSLGVPVVSMVLDKSATLITYFLADRLVTTAPHLVPVRHRFKVEQVFWGANTEMFHPRRNGSAIREKYGIGAEAFLIGYTGAYYPWHGLHTLVEAAFMLESDPRASHFRYLLVGDGQTRKKVAGHIARRGLDHRFVFAGKVAYDDVPRYQAACDLCVAPYNPSKHRELRKYGMFFDPLKVFEYLSSGKPTITLDSANMRRLLTNEKHALLVPPGSPPDLAKAIMRVATAPRLRVRLGREGRLLVETNYSWQAHADTLTRIFQEVVS